MIDLFGLFSLIFRVIQMNTTPTIATAPNPTSYKDSWQQRRYNFLRKNSMFSSELKDDAVDVIGINEQDTEAESR